EAPLSQDETDFITLRRNVTGIASAEQFGHFQLQADQVPPPTAFVSLAGLAEETENPSKANLLLVGGGGQLTPRAANQAVEQTWTRTDAGLELRALAEPNQIELRSPEVFLPRPVIEAAHAAEPNAMGVFSYFIKQASSGDASEPYFIAAGIGGLGEGAPPPAVTSVLPADVADDEIVLNEWIAEDLDAEPGDEVTLTYWVMGPMRQLDTKSRSFTVRRIVPMQGLAADPNLMPPFPGLADVEDCRYWDPGVPIDVGVVENNPRIQEYWDRYRGTPKAFVRLDAAQQMWSNRFGELTAIRWPGQTTDADALAARLLDRLDPAAVGLYFQDVRERAMAASTGATDFGGMFVGFSFFLILAAVLLTALLFVFGIQQRSGQAGVLLAAGWRPRRVALLMLGEGAILAGLGAILGVFGGLAYSRALLVALRTVWSEAIPQARETVQFHAQPATVVLAAVGGAVVSLGAMVLAMRKQYQLPVRKLLAGDLEQTAVPRNVTRATRGLAALATGGALALLVALALGASGTVMLFFAAGGLLLVSGILWSAVGLGHLGRRARGGQLSLNGLGVRNASRRRGRSLATLGLLACGSFLVVVVAANQVDPVGNPHAPHSGTGGFELYAETTVAIPEDLNTPEGRRPYRLRGEAMEQSRFVPMRLREGDNASCLNLNRAQQPRLLGVDPNRLAGRFRFASTIEGAPEDPWDLLKRDEIDGAIPAIADQSTIKWALQKSIGDTLSYTDQQGREFRVRLVAGLERSMLQGQLLISEQSFLQKYGTANGYRVFLVDTPPQRMDEASDELTDRLGDQGAWVMSAARRLAEFTAVENTYKSIFGVVGGLGLILGSAGIAVVVARNVLERRGELALLRAVGFQKSRLTRMLLTEHLALLVGGLLIGVVAAVLAVVPALRHQAGQVSLPALAIVLAGVLLNGLLWTWLATRLALRGELLPALRSE
ncbi:MAG: ABC transporter permease, partial [Planctomycetota bacterium]